VYEFISPYLLRLYPYPYLFRNLTNMRYNQAAYYAVFLIFFYVSIDAHTTVYLFSNSVSRIPHI